MNFFGIKIVKTVTVNSNMKYEAIVKNLERLGELRLEKSSYKTNGSTEVIFRERTLGDFFKEILPWNKTLAIQSRRAVMSAFEPLISKELHSEQLCKTSRIESDTMSV